MGPQAGAASPRGRWPGPWHEGEAFLYGRMREVRWKEVVCLWRVLGHDVTVKAVVAEVEGSKERFTLVGSAVGLTGLQMVELFAASFRQEDGFRDLKQRLGWEECRAWTRKPIERTSQAQWVTMRLLRLLQFGLDAQGDTGWWSAPPWDKEKDRPSVLDVERLLRRHRPEMLRFLSAWLGDEEEAACDGREWRSRRLIRPPDRVRCRECRASGPSYGAGDRETLCTIWSVVQLFRETTVYLHWFEKLFARRDGPGTWANAKLVRYADDFVVLARYQSRRLTDWIETTLEGRFHLTINREKTRIVKIRQPGESLTFLDFTLRYDHNHFGGNRRYLNVFPSAKAQARAREKLRELTDHHRCSAPIPEVIDEVNRWMRGWGNYFRHGSPGKVFASLNCFVQNRMRRHLQRRSQRHLRPPEGVTFYAYLQRLGLQRLKASHGRLPVHAFGPRGSG